MSVVPANPNAPQTIAHRVLRVMLESNPRFRGWSQVVPDDSGASSFSVVSYNLLSRTLASECTKFTQNTHVPNPRHWANRSALLLRELQAMDADILCLQELDKSDHDGAFGTGLEQLGYAGAHQTRNADQEHGFGLFFKADKFTEVRSEFVPCPDKDVVRGVGCAGILTVLDVKEGMTSQRRVCVISTHIVCSRMRGFAQLAQLMALIAAAKAVMKRDMSIPLILAGDLNALSDSVLVEFLSQGSVDVSSTPADQFCRGSFGRSSSTVGENHKKRVEDFKRETWEMRGLTAPVASGFFSKAEELRLMSKTTQDLWNGCDQSYTPYQRV
ncbi:Protein angel 2 [Mortierella alpina]|uniref:Protein angel 2 n=1 Tax=Mortierella alpina TaxID=64518 RepID=A0A9P6JDX3_MORAP|nr:Protein angel 2 [Mortierella alpina]